MGWVRIEDTLPEHPKMMMAEPLALAMYVAGLCYCNRTLSDGFIPKAKVPSLLDMDPYGGASVTVQRMVRVGLWDEVENGYQIHDYLDYQPSKQEARDKQAKRAERQKRWRDGATRNDKGQFVDAGVDASRSRRRDADVDPYPTQPNPIRDVSTSYLQADVVESPQSVTKRERPRNELWDTLMAVCRIDTSGISAGSRARYGKVLKELKSMGATPDEIVARAVAFRVAFKSMSLTPSALLSRWAEVEGCATQPDVSREQLAIQKWINS